MSGEERLWGQVGQFYMLLIVSVGDLSGEIRLWGQVGQFYKLFWSFSLRLVRRGQAVRTGRTLLHALLSFSWRPVTIAQAVRTGSTVSHALRSFRWRPVMRGQAVKIKDKKASTTYCTLRSSNSCSTCQKTTGCEER
jgi:hypothetical protein